MWCQRTFYFILQIAVVRLNSFCKRLENFRIFTVMFEYDFNDCRIVDDNVDDIDIMKSIVETNNQENAFYIVDIAAIAKKHTDWIKKMPRVVPYFAVKCNPDPTVIKTLAALNGCFDCASQQEIQQVMANGVSGERIIFANPAKLNSHIIYARKVGVDKMTVDGKEEIMKLKELFPTAKLLIRIRNDGLIDPDVMTSLGEKFGCDPESEALTLIKFMKEIDMKLYGFSFHAGSPCPDNLAYTNGIKICKRLIDYAKSIGIDDVRMIDIGGGFLGLTDEQLESVAQAINETLEDIDPSIEIISEPGRYYVESSFTLAALVHSKKEIIQGNIVKQIYYVNDGVYGSFVEELLELKEREPFSLYKKAQNGEKFVSTIWGPTCDSYDRIVKDKLLPKFSIGDWMVWRNMGAYTISLACSFNGMLPPDVYPFIRKSQMNVVKAAIDEAQGISPARKQNGFYISGKSAT